MLNTPAVKFFAGLELEQIILFPDEYVFVLVRK